MLHVSYYYIFLTSASNNVNYFYTAGRDGAHGANGCLEGVFLMIV